MKKFIEKNLKLKFTKNDDLTDRQFTYIRTDTEVNEELSVLGNIRYTIVSEWKIFMSNYKEDIFKKNLSNMYNDIFNVPLSSNDVLYPSNSFDTTKQYYLESYSMSTENTENGDEISLIFTIKGD